MSKIKNDGLDDHYGAEPFKQQQFGTAGVEGVNLYHAHAAFVYYGSFLHFCYDDVYSSLVCTFLCVSSSLF